MDRITDKTKCANQFPFIPWSICFSVNRLQATAVGVFLTKPDRETWDCIRRAIAECEQRIRECVKPDKPGPGPGDCAPGFEEDDMGICQFERGA